LTAKEIIQTVRGNSERGEKFYKQLCATCHGVNARGTDVGSALWTLEDWYLLSQLRKYKNGQRAYHPDDTESLIMKAVVNDLNDQDLKDIIKYLRDNFTPGT
jgi:cytochrome c553